LVEIEAKNETKLKIGGTLGPDGGVFNYIRYKIKILVEVYKGFV
jgi:hypothetical protein